METNQLPSQAQPYQDDEEIDLRQLLLKIWATRVPVVGALLSVTVIYWGIWAFKHQVIPSSHTYSRIIQFTFKGIEEEEYPNSSPFSLADVIAPGVLSLVYDENSLSEWNIPELKFIQSFNIEPFAPDYDLIIKKYQDILNNSKLSTEEINKYQQQMKDEISRASINSAKISFTPPAKGFRIPSNLLKKVLLDVPRIWAKKAIESDGVTKLDMKIYSSKMFNEERFASLDYMVAFDLIMDNISLIKENIKLLMDQPNGRIISDEKSGYRLPDLEKALNDIVDYDIKQLESPIRDLGIAKNTGVVKLYYEYSIQDLEREMKLVNSQSEAVQQTLNNYNSYNVSQTSGPGTTYQQVTPSGAVVPQFSGDFLERIIQLTEQSSDLQYRQTLTDQILKFRKKAVEISSQIEREKSIVSSMNAKTDAENKLRKYYVELIINNLPKILQKLQDYTEITNRLYDKLSKENLGYTGLLYKNSGNGMTVSGRLISFRDLQVFVLLLFMTGIAALIITMIYQVLRTSRKT